MTPAEQEVIRASLALWRSLDRPPTLTAIALEQFDAAVSSYVIDLCVRGLAADAEEETHDRP